MNCNQEISLNVLYDAYLEYSEHFENTSHSVLVLYSYVNAL